MICISNLSFTLELIKSCLYPLTAVNQLFNKVSNQKLTSVQCVSLTCPFYSPIQPHKSPPKCLQSIPECLKSNTNVPFSKSAHLQSLLTNPTRLESLEK